MVDDAMMMELWLVAAEHDAVPKDHEWREALKLARKLRDEGIADGNAARAAGTVVFTVGAKGRSRVRWRPVARPTRRRAAGTRRARTARRQGSGVGRRRATPGQRTGSTSNFAR